MKSPRVRQLAFELLEPKASPSAVLLAVAPLDEPQQAIFEAQHAMYATSAVETGSDANVALLEFIERNTQGDVTEPLRLPLPTPQQAAVADHMMAATDADLRSMLIAEMLQANPAASDHVVSVIQY